MTIVEHLRRERDILDFRCSHFEIFKDPGDELGSNQKNKGKCIWPAKVFSY